MSFMLEDGTGTGNKLKITDQNRIVANSISINTIEEANIFGDGFVFQTGDITLTSDSESAVIYFKNDNDFDITMTQIAVYFDNSTGGTPGDIILNHYKNSSGGTIISNQDAVAINTNLNFGSSKSSGATMYQGDEGYTQTGGELFLKDEELDTIGIVVYRSVLWVLPKGSTWVMTATPPTGNTSMKIRAGGIFHKTKSL